MAPPVVAGYLSEPLGDGLAGSLYGILSFDPVFPKLILSLTISGDGCHSLRNHISFVHERVISPSTS